MPASSPTLPTASPSTMPAGFGPNGLPYGQSIVKDSTNPNGAVQFTGMPSAPSSSTPTSEPAVMSTQSGQQALTAAAQKQSGMMATVQSPTNGSSINGVSAATPTTDTSKVSSIQAQGGVTAKEASAAGIDLSGYQYDSASGYYMPPSSGSGTSMPGVESDQQFQEDKTAVANAFGAQMANMTASESAMVAALTNSYQSQMNNQADVNRGELASFSTMMARGGTSQYAPGVAASIFTAAETAGLAKIQGINAQLTSAIMSAQDSLQKEEYTAFVDQQSEIDKLTAARTSALQNLQAENDKKQQMALAEKQFNETVYKDSQDLADSRYDMEPVMNAFGQKIGVQAYDKQTGQPVGKTVLDPGQSSSDPSQMSTPVVTVNTTTGAPDPQSQQQYLQSLPKTYQSLVQGIANGKIEPPSARTAQGAAILSMVANYDPGLSDGQGGFDATKYAARLTMAKSLANYSAGSYGSALISANKVISHLASFYNSASSLPNGAINPLGINKAMNTIAGGIGALIGKPGIQSAEAQGNQEALGLTDEMTKFFKGTGGTDVSSLESWGKTLNPNASPGTQQGVIQGTLNLFTGQLNSFIQQYTTTMGKEPDLGTIVQPQTMATLQSFKDAGFKVDLPGVYYTDPTSYIKYGGGSQDSLSSAYNALKALNDPNNPPTPENVLQYAQLTDQ